MKKFLPVLLFILSLSIYKGFAQAESEKLKVTPSYGVGVVSNYAFRGIDFGGASLQPYIALDFYGFRAEAWGSFGWKPNYENMYGELDFSLDYTYKNFSVGFLGMLFSDVTMGKYFIPMDTFIGDVRFKYNTTYFAAAWNVQVINDDNFSSFVALTGKYPYKTWEFSLTCGVAPYGGWLYGATGFAFNQIEANVYKSIKLNDKYSMGASLGFGYNPYVNGWLYALRVHF